MRWRMITFVASLLCISLLERVGHLPSFAGLAVACAIYLALFLPPLTGGRWR